MEAFSTCQKTTPPFSICIMFHWFSNSDTVFHNFRMENFQSPLARLQDCCWSWPTVTWAHSIVFQHTIASCHSSRIFWCTKFQNSRQCNSSEILAAMWGCWSCHEGLGMKQCYLSDFNTVKAPVVSLLTATPWEAMRSMAMPARASNCDTSPYIPYKGARNFKKLSPSSTGQQSGRMCETRCKLWLVVIWDLLGRQFWGMISLFKKYWFHHCNQEAKIGCTCCQQQSLNLSASWQDESLKYWAWHKYLVLGSTTLDHVQCTTNIHNRKRNLMSSCQFPRKYVLALKTLLWFSLQPN